MIHQRGWLYVVGWSPRRQRLRQWKIDCIERVALVWLESRRAEGFDPRQHWARLFGVFHGESEVHVQVRFWTMAARCVQDGRWHRRRKLTRQADDSILAEFDLSSTEEIKRWILGFGRHATVFAPQRLRQQMKGQLRAVAFQNRERL
mgnify:FL=1